MPFVLWYSFQRAGIYFMSCLGTVRNPYRICMAGLSMASAGRLCLALGMGNLACWNVGAVLVGLGLSGFSSMWRTTRDEMQNQGLADFGNSMVWGYVVFFGCLGTVLLLGMSNKSVAVGCLVFLVFSSWAYMASLGKINPYGGQRMFNAASQHRESVLYALAVLALTLCVRLFRQTADAWTMAFLPVALALVLWLARRQRIAPYRGHSLRTLWYGAVTNFLYVFSLFYLTSIGEARTLDVVYFAIGAGAAVPTLVGPWVKQWVGSARYEELCILCAAISSAVLMVPSLYVVGTAFVSMFVTMGSQESFEVYLADNRFPAEERRLVRAKFYGIGCVYEQTMMLVAIFACSALAGGGATSAMAGYALRESAATNAQAYHWALLVCLVANAVAGFLLMRSTGDEVASQSAVRSL